jgi:hypothetical protein
MVRQETWGRSAMRRLTILACIAGFVAAPLPAFAYSCVLSPTKDAVIVKTDNPSDRETTCKVDCLFTSPEGPVTGFLRAADTGKQEGLVRLPAPDRRQGAGVRARKPNLPIANQVLTSPVYAPPSASAKQRREAFFAVAGEIDDAAAGGAVACRPFQFGEPCHHRSTERAGKMMAPLAPVKTGLAHRAPRMAKAFSGYLQGFGQEPLALGGQLDVLFPLAHQPLIFHAVEHLHAEIAGEMIVANPRAAQRRILRSGTHAHVARARREPREALEHAGDIGAGKAIIAVAALFLRFDQAAG